MTQSEVYKIIKESDGLVTVNYLYKWLNKDKKLITKAVAKLYKYGFVKRYLVRDIKKNYYAYSIVK